MIGVLSLPLTLASELEQARSLPDFPDIPLGVLIGLSLIQPALLLAGGVAVGVRLAPRLGLRSHLAEGARDGTAVWPRVRGEIPAALLWGLIAGMATALLDLAFLAWQGDTAGEADGGPLPLARLVVGLLYGGVTEELMVRWGLMSLLAWAGWRLVQGRRGAPRAPVMWAAIVLTAIVFGLGHLPAVASVVALTPVVVTRTVLLNALGGIVFGWLFWRRSLEAAMVAHASVHIVFAMFSIAGL
jgi:hypothetical protein